MFSKYSNIHIDVDVGEKLVVCKDGTIRGSASNRKYMSVEYSYPLCESFRIIIHTYETEAEVFLLFVTEFYIYSCYTDANTRRPTGKHVIINDNAEAQNTYKSVLGDLSLTRIPETLKKRSKQ